MFVFDVISLAFSFCPVGDVSDVVDDDDAVTDAILFSCILPSQYGEKEEKFISFREEKKKTFVGAEKKRRES